MANTASRKVVQGMSPSIAMWIIDTTKALVATNTLLGTRQRWSRKYLLGFPRPRTRFVDNHLF